MHYENVVVESLPALSIIGVRGVPAAHGGFETFAEHLALWLTDCGWKVTVYCQGSETGRYYEDEWRGIRRIHIPVNSDSSLGTIEFDIKSAFHAVRQHSIFLTLGYNTGFLNILFRIFGKKNYVNMDGLEWKRTKYSRFERAYLWVNERLAALAGTKLIADHPNIERYLAQRTNSRKIVMIPYGAEGLSSADRSLLNETCIEPYKFLTVIARPVPENSVLEIVQAFSSIPRDVKLVVLGNYRREDAFQAQVLAAASSDVLFIGAIYDKAMLAALRYYSLAYIHGHTVGGTNPSLVEALAAGNPILAHDNEFNRWVAGEAGMYFSDVASCVKQLEILIGDETTQVRMRFNAKERWKQSFQWPQVLQDYALLLSESLPQPARTSPQRSAMSGGTEETLVDENV